MLVTQNIAALPKKEDWSHGSSTSHSDWSIMASQAPELDGHAQVARSGTRCPALSGSGQTAILLPGSPRQAVALITRFQLHPSGSQDPV
ncbi:hypothetical protein ACOMHN_010944 [Nucella lapillus]